ncbi:pyrroloquinoline quinone biosynthesis protein PqqE [Lichenifustis flavocetrariae]|uniref:PqqA peptide cyclase n=1 Tax=Lichenifustis flavocetrariae TaxID=2949735 RepID=A0AA42CJ93_9HYPH|nr:pyrroloquinoline quinone biosynthesis protein PqqE [Lichenifustis flavocetrariae]MCW6507786.1 pyrroloquinoline quinone biosynthesis protein PqqE [Lichenifustis flavocetrariae]
MTAITPRDLPAPIGLLAELTHRCPLGCPYCSNPIELDARAGELDTATWQRVFGEAAALGILHVHLSGGEPLTRRDLADLVAHCAHVGLYTNLITSGVGLTRPVMTRLAEAGLDHVQLSIQDSEATSADHIAGYQGAFARKREAAALVQEAGLPLTVNAVIHRANVARAGAMVALAITLGARRVEIAHTQYYGWGLRNRSALMPSRDEAKRAIAEIERLKVLHAGTIVIDHVAPDYHARYPKACMGGWARRSLNVTPSGRVLPCHAAETIPGLEFWSVATHALSTIWADSPAFQAYRGTDWMQEPCRSCARKEIDWGGCRCQALALAGDAAATDPVCMLSPNHAVVAAIAEAEGVQPVAEGPIDYVYRRMPARSGASSASD